MNREAQQRKQEIAFEQKICFEFEKVYHFSELWHRCILLSLKYDFLSFKYKRREIISKLLSSKHGCTVKVSNFSKSRK